MLYKHGSILVAIFLAICLAVMSATPPSPKSADTPDNQFSSTRAMEDVRIIAAKPHPTGSDENAKVRAYLARRLTELGANVSVQDAELPERGLARLNKWSGADVEALTLQNVIGVIPGADRAKPAVLLMAHHDTVWGSPGAADDTIGIASILEITRALNENGAPNRDLVILFTDAEELGLNGAKAFFKTHPLQGKIGAVVNFEARGGGGTANMFQTSAQNGHVAQLYARSVKEPSVSSLSTFVYNVLPNDTDLTPALEKDYAAYNIANIGRAGYYHSPKIDAKALEEATLQHMGSQGLDLTRALLSSEPLPAPTRDATFFDVFGLFTVIYAPGLGTLFLVLGMLFYVWAETKDMPKKLVRLKLVGLGSLRMVAFLVLGGGLLYGLNRLSGHGSGADYYDRLAAINTLEVVAVLACLTAAFTVFGGKTLSAQEQLGAAAPLFVLGYVGQMYAPTAAYFITASLLFCGLVSLLMSRWGETKTGPIISALICAVIVGYMLSLGHLLSLGVGPNMLAANILPAAIAVLVLLPVYAGIPSKTKTYLAGGALGLAVIVALWIRLDPVAVTVPVY